MRIHVYACQLKHYDKKIQSMISMEIAGIAVKLDPIEQNMMDSGSWCWNYKIKGTHIHLEIVES